jgi:hypothetical protein
MLSGGRIHFRFKTCAFGTTENHELLGDLKNDKNKTYEI